MYISVQLSLLPSVIQRSFTTSCTDMSEWNLSRLRLGCVERFKLNHGKVQESFTAAHWLIVLWLVKSFAVTAVCVMLSHSEDIQKLNVKHENQDKYRVKWESLYTAMKKAVFTTIESLSKQRCYSCGSLLTSSWENSSRKATDHEELPEQAWFYWNSRTEAGWHDACYEQTSTYP